ncbi:hypothetical protein [Actinophytocola xanthii]|uniref:Secreted protein n=1 Tax=Actinophytocola xanthii TaxID=1912961 RepID=A0A1Q8CGY0_9PSEU|nr:hypothetical protein [Actinophytocola xanthii]OLF13616.1 hypothetical protein BU204_26620 [Actinophytocola xanthii]
MRGRLTALLAVGASALTAVVVAATPASAAAPWTITPGGPANGVAGTTNLTVQDADGNTLEMSCASSTAGVVLESGEVPGPLLATIPEEGGIEFQDCLLAGLITFEVDQVGDWTINGVSYDAATGVTTGTIDGVEANVSGPGCSATVAGSVNGTYTNDTDVLRVLPDFTLTVTFVDATDDCLGLLHEGDQASFDGAYEVTPDQTITG